jgi:hypothetical protein
MSNRLSIRYNFGTFLHQFDILILNELVLTFPLKVDLYFSRKCKITLETTQSVTFFRLWQFVGPSYSFFSCRSKLRLILQLESEYWTLPLKKLLQEFLYLLYKIIKHTTNINTFSFLEHSTNSFTQHFRTQLWRKVNSGSKSLMHYILI